MNEKGEKGRVGIGYECGNFYIKQKAGKDVNGLTQVWHMRHIGDRG